MCRKIWRRSQKWIQTYENGMELPSCEAVDVRKDYICNFVRPGTKQSGTNWRLLLTGNFSNLEQTSKCFQTRPDANLQASTNLKVCTHFKGGTNFKGGTDLKMCTDFKAGTTFKDIIYFKPGTNQKKWSPTSNLVPTSRFELTLKLIPTSKMVLTLKMVGNLLLLFSLTKAEP